MSEINVVPYIDVMLVLLVIFMVTAPLLTQGVQVDLPQAQSRPLDDANAQPVILTVDATGKYFLNIGEDPAQPISSETLVARVTAQLQLTPDRRVLVKGDKTVQYSEVLYAMALLQRAGARGVGLVAENPRS